MIVLVIGYGSMGQRHARNARTLGATVVVSEADAGQRALAREDGFPTIADTTTIADAVIIAAPAHTHAMLLSEVLDTHRGRVLVEKPLALDATSAAGAIGVSDLDRVWVGCNWRFHPAVERARAQCPQADVGLFAVCSDRATWPGAAYADTLLECGAHEVDLAQWWLGPINRIVRASTTPRRAGGLWWDLLLQHASGGTSAIVLDDHSATPLRTGHVIGPDGASAQYTATPLGDRGDVESSYLRELAAFLAPGVSDPPLATAADGLAVLRVLDAARALVALGA